jgi:hypothetical protein
MSWGTGGLKEIQAGFGCEKLKENDHLKDLEEEERIKIKRVLKE